MLERYLESEDIFYRERKRERENFKKPRTKRWENSWRAILWSRPWNFVVPSEREIFFTEEASITLSIAGDKGFRKERTVLGTRTDPWQCRPTREAISPSPPVLRRHRKDFPFVARLFPLWLSFFPIGPCFRALFPACYRRRRYFRTELRAIAREWVIKRARIRSNELLHPVLVLRCLERCNLFNLAWIFR